jgi:hypothetical protein
MVAREGAHRLEPDLDWKGFWGGGGKGKIYSGSELQRPNGLAYVSNYEHRIVPFPDVPMPENIKGFKEIALGYF